ncbi:polysaccharide deacetylase family protein [Jiangella endophytica]|uniref:polysaccharide deacetylase family protein n=1 Tax=Jiangella endophytica TaxID=1623398 RepID=UPI0018E566C1|nr:polysaccharide deacetylase family protein [Jiangella endophytica]
MIINLCFHGIGSCEREREPGEARYWMAEPMFQRVLDEVTKHSHVRLSFDDGNASDVEVALPSLKERGLQATFFALAGRLEDPVSLSAADLVELRGAGMAIGTHGWAHVPWRGLSAAEAGRELVEARAALTAASDGPISEAALPLGRYDRRLLGRLRRAGYTVVYTSDKFPARSASWLQARYSVTASDTVETVRSVITHRPGLRDARNAAVSTIKRWR